MVSELQNWEKTEQSSWCERNSGQDGGADTTDENRGIMLRGGSISSSMSSSSSLPRNETGKKIGKPIVEMNTSGHGQS